MERPNKLERPNTRGRLEQVLENRGESEEGGGFDLGVLTDAACTAPTNCSVWPLFPTTPMGARLTRTLARPGACAASTHSRREPVAPTGALRRVEHSGLGAWDREPGVRR